MVQPTLSLLNRRLLMLLLPGAALLLFIRLFVPESTLMASPAFINTWLAAYQDPFWLLGVAILVIAAGRVNSAPRMAATLDRLTAWGSRQSFPVLRVTLATTLIAALGVDWVYYRFSLSMDEFLLVWQARVFLAGHLLAPIPEGWAELSRALQPMFMIYDLANNLWYPGYQPLSSALYALFDLFAIGPWSNALLAGGSVTLTAAIARRTWPEERQAPGLAALLLATSPQLLITAMTPYAMTGHLFFNLLWLWLFLSDTRRGHLLAAFVGLVACGLHQPHVHPLFILPFMILLLRQRRWHLALAYAAWYTAVLMLWLYWRDIATLGVGGGMGNSMVSANASGTNLLKHIHALLEGFQGLRIPLVIINLARFLAWQNPLVLALLIPALIGLRQAPSLVWMLLWSILLNIIAHAALMPGQGHGWGYRYLHVYLGSMALIGVWGWLWVWQALNARDRNTGFRIGVILLLAGVLVGLPLRALQTESFVRPFAQADQYMNSLDTDFIFIDGRDIWFGVDLTRNDPLLRNNPKVMVAQYAGGATLHRLCHGKTAVLIDHLRIEHLGMRAMPRTQEDRELELQQLRQHLNATGCAFNNIILAPAQLSWPQ